MLQKFFLILILSSLFYADLLAGAWPQKKGNGYYKLDFRFLNAKNIYDSDGEKISLNGTLKDYTLGFYGEYGITSFFTVTGSFLYFKSLSLESNPGPTTIDESQSGIGDLALGIKLLLLRINQTVISSGITLGIPTGKGAPDGELLLGDGEFNQLINVQVGHSFFPSPFYVNGIVGFNNRSKGFSDEFRYVMEGGYTFNFNITLIVRVHGVQPLLNGDDNILGGYGIFMNNQKFLAYGTEVIYNLTEAWGISATYESGTAGKNIVSTPVFSFGIFFHN